MKLYINILIYCILIEIFNGFFFIFESQFHQQSMSSFFVRKSFAQVFCGFHKMLEKMTPGVISSALFKHLLCQ